MRTPEQGHTRACLAAAMICAIENMRDEAADDLDFRLWAQDHGALSRADEYLNTGTATCTCGPAPGSNCRIESSGGGSVVTAHYPPCTDEGYVTCDGVRIGRTLE